MRKIRKIKIGRRLIGKGEPCFIIAEAGSNHDRKLNQALRLIEVAAEAGADAVKFQVFSADGIVANTKERIASLRRDKFGAYGKTLYELYKKLEMPKEWLARLQKHARDCGIIFCATPFDEETVDELEKVGVAFYKIASFELVHIPLIKYVASRGKPIIISTGMATIPEIAEATEAVRRAGNDQYALLHCAIEYPPRMRDLNLAAMDIMYKRFKCPIGYSDHTLGITIPVATVARGAKIIEKHYTISRKLKGPDHRFALDPVELKLMVKAIRDVEEAIGISKKGPVPAEEIHLKRGRRSIFAACDIEPGQVITESMTAILRPASGLAPKFLEKVIGKRAKTDIADNEPITWDKLF